MDQPATKEQERDYDGTTSLLSIIPGSLLGLSSVITAFKGGNTAPVTQNYYTGGGGPGGIGWGWIIGIIIAIVLIIAFTMGGSKKTPAAS